MVDKLGWNGAIAFWVVSTVICVGICTFLMIDEKKGKTEAK